MNKVKSDIEKSDISNKKYPDNISKETPDNPEIAEEELIENEEESVSQEELENRREDFEKEAMPYINLLQNYAYRMCGNRLDADDLVQETYLRAFRFFDKFERGTNCKAWLFRIMKNLFINNYRKSQKQPGQVDYSEIENFFDNIKSKKIDSNDLQEKIFSHLLDDDLTNALNSLQDDFKTVVILCDLEGLSYEEIAEFVQCPIGTVRSRLHRGRKLLQQKLFEYAKERGYDVESAID